MAWPIHIKYTLLVDVILKCFVIIYKLSTQLLLPQQCLAVNLHRNDSNEFHTIQYMVSDQSLVSELLQGEETLDRHSPTYHQTW